MQNDQISFKSTPTLQLAASNIDVEAYLAVGHGTGIPQLTVGAPGFDPQPLVRTMNRDINSTIFEVFDRQPL